MSFAVVTMKLLEGFGTTCLIFFVTLAASLPLGLIVCFGSMSRFRPLRWLTRAFIWVIRGTPLMLQIIIVFMCPALPSVWPVQSAWLLFWPHLSSTMQRIFPRYTAEALKASPKASMRPAGAWHDRQADIFPCGSAAGNKSALCRPWATRLSHL